MDVVALLMSARIAGCALFCGEGATTRLPDGVMSVGA